MGSEPGLTVTAVSPSLNYVTVSGTVAQIERAFGTSIHSVSENGTSHFANITDPSLPSSIAGVVSGITGLNDFKFFRRVAPAVPPVAPRLHRRSAVVTTWLPAISSPSTT